MAGSEEQSGLILESVEQHVCERCGVEMDVLGVEPFKSFNCPECGAPFVVPARLGPFLLLSQIGRGGMGGVVFLARDELLDRNVAIKIMPASVGRNEEVVATFRREAQAAARLNHPNIAQVYSFGQENGQPYIVMELLSGASLDKMIDEEGQLNEGFVIHVGLQIAQGLRAADEASLTHGDIKPENILFDDKMNAKLVDFGIASFVNQASEGIWGTPYYIAPERLLRMKSDARSDMYCLGGTLYHALTGRPPFEGRTPAEVVRARLEIDPTPVREVRRNVHTEVDELVMRMLKREPAVRHPTYASLIGDLARAAKVVPYGGTTAAFASVKAGKRVILTGTGGKSPKSTSGSSRASGAIKVFSKSKDSQQISGSSNRSTGSIKTPRVSKGRAGSARKFVKGLVWLLILGGLAAGGLWLYLSVKESRDTKINERKEQLSLKEARSKAELLWPALVQSVSNVNRYANMACGYTGNVIQAVQTVINEAIDLPPPPPPPVVPGLEPAATNLAAAGTNAVEAGSNTVAAVPNTTPPVTASNAPPLLASEPPVEVGPEPEIKTLAKKALGAVRDVLNMRDSVERLSGEGETSRDAVASATSAQMASDHVATLSEKLDACKKTEADAKKRIEDIKPLVAKIDGIRTKFETAREKAIQEEKERQRLAAEAQKKRDDEARKEALIGSEKASARLARVRAQAYMRDYAFGRAVEEMKAEKANYQTDEGKFELQKNIDRYQRLEGLHRFIVERLTKEPFSWGWISGRNEDVTGADEKGVSTKTRVYPWAEVTIRQYLHFFSHYAEDRKLHARDAADNYLAAAIFCMESVLGTDNEKMKENARNKAMEYSERAKKLTPTVGEDVARLLDLE